MKIIFNSPKSTIGLLKKMVKLIGKNAVIPIVECFLIESHEDKTAIIGATDLEHFAKAVLHEVQTDGKKWSVAIYAKNLMDALSQFDERQGVVCTFDDKKDEGVFVDMKGFLNGQPLSYRFPCENGADFPSFPELDKDDLHSKVKGADLVNALNSVSFACSKDELRPAMTGVYFDSKDSKFLTLAATNGHILSESILARTGKMSVNSFIMTAKVANLLSLFVDNQNVEIFCNKSNSTYKFGGIELMCRNIDARYPDYKAVVPSQYCEILSFSKKDMLKQLTAANIELKKRTKVKGIVLTSALWKIDKTKTGLFLVNGDKYVNGNKIYTYDDTAFATVAANWDETPFTIGLDVANTLLFLKNLQGKGDTVEFRISGNTRAILVKMGDSTQNQGLLMPVMYEGLENFTCSHELSPIAPIRTEPLPDDDEVDVLPTPSVKVEGEPLFEVKDAPSVSNPKTFVLFDTEGKRRIDDEAIKFLEDGVHTLPQTKETNSKNGKYTAERQKLHEKIINDLTNKKRCTHTGQQPIAVLTGGAPGSGKSYFLKNHYPWLQKSDVFSLDSDEVRAMLPEYEGWNAHITHEETSDVVKTLFKKISPTDCKWDVVFDGTMTNIAKYKEYTDYLSGQGYAIYAIFMQVPADVSKRRALERYRRNGRYVPMVVIDDINTKKDSVFQKLKTTLTGWIEVDGQTGEVLSKGGAPLPKERDFVEEAEPTWTNYYAKLTDEQIIESQLYGRDTKLLKTCDPFKKDERVAVSLYGMDKDVLDKYDGKEARVFACVQKKHQKVYKEYLVRFDDGFYHGCRLEDLKKVTPSVKTPNFDIEAEKIRIAAESRKRRIRILKLQNA